MKALLKTLKRLYWHQPVDLLKCVAVWDAAKHVWHHPFDRLPLTGVGAEIGVYRGCHARDMLAAHPEITTLYCVDEYVPYGVENGEIPMLKEARTSAHYMLRHYKDKVIWVEMSSPGALSYLPPLDFCYIDGNHSYEGVKKDIAAVWPKIKPGGYMGGHDFWYGFPGVIQAVVEFASARRAFPLVYSPDWWVRKEA